jgi:hypothetical protein
MAIGRATLALLVCSGLAVANSIIVQSLDTPLGEKQSLYIDENGTATQLYWSGGLNASVDGHTRIVWCVQLFVNISIGTTYNTVVDWADTTQLQRVGWMVQNLAGGLTTQAQGAAFQLAIWDIMEDNGDGFGVGAGKVYQSTSAAHPTDATVLALAQQYEMQSAGKLFKWVPVYHNVQVTNGKAVQNLIGPLTYDGGVDAMAPEPDGLWMMIGGLAMIAAACAVRHFRRGSSKDRSDAASTR